MSIYNVYIMIIQPLFYTAFLYQVGIYCGIYHGIYYLINRLYCTFQSIPWLSVFYTLVYTPVSFVYTFYILGVMYLVYTPSTLFLKHSILNFHKCTPLCFATTFCSFIISKFYTKWYPYTITVYQNCQPFWPVKVIDPLVHPLLFYLF